LKVSVFSVIVAVAAGIVLSSCATGTTVTQSGEGANGAPVVPTSASSRPRKRK
jgi:hypothetical protein